jgi:hypothetical protein
LLLMLPANDPKRLVSVFVSRPLLFFLSLTTAMVSYAALPKSVSGLCQRLS